MMPDLNDLYYYAQVVDYAGFSPASRALGIPKSKLSRRVALLEERLGVRLIQRSTRHFSVTEIGLNYYEHCKAMLIEAGAAQEAIELIHAEPCGVIRMSCPIALLHADISGMLADFMVLYPRVTIQLEASNRRVDPISEAIDLAIRVRPLPLQDSDLIMRVLAQRSQCLVASDTVCAQYGEVHSPADLMHWPSLGLGTAQQHFAWTLFDAQHVATVVPHVPRMITTDMLALRHAAIAGVGVVQMPMMMVRAELAQGRLLQLLPDWTLQHDIIHVVYPSRRGLLPSVRALIDYLAERFAALDEDYS